MPFELEGFGKSLRAQLGYADQHQLLSLGVICRSDAARRGIAGIGVLLGDVGAGVSLGVAVVWLLRAREGQFAESGVSLEW